jgi:fructose-bisphosphate aldolase class II
VDTSAVEYDKSLFTKPEEVVDFVEKTGVDALAIAIGTLHGVYRGTPQLDYDRLQNIRSKVKVGLVMHGGSGLPDSDFKKATQIGIDKVNVYTELSIFAMEHVRTTLETVKEWLDVSKSMRLSLKEFIKDRIATFGGAGMAGSSQAVSPKDRIANSSNVI